MEMLDIYDESGKFIGSEDRKVIHRDGLWHKTIHCWLYTSNGDIFFQRRADRGTLYTTASGHVSAGESLVEAFGREVFEELGSKINYESAEFCSVVNFIMDRELDDGSVFKDRAFANIYVCKYDQEYDFNYDINELSGIVRVNAKEVKELFNYGAGCILGEEIIVENDIIVINKRSIDFSEFLVNKGETAIGKYGDVLNKIIELTE